MNPAEIWAVIIALSVTLYAVLDGFDLGVGMLLLIRKTGEERTEMLNSIYPTWDGNETWIVLAGVGLYGGFPEAYGTLLPFLYVPFIVMLLSFIFRGVSLEFRFNAKGRMRKVWDTFFGVASYLIVIAQGLILGSMVHAALHPGFFAAGNLSVFGFVSPTSVLMASIWVVVLMLHGLNWLTLKGNDELRHDMGVSARWLLIGLLLLVGFFIYAHLRLPAFAGPNGPYALNEVMSPGVWGALGLGVCAALASFLAHRASKPAWSFRAGLAMMVFFAIGVVMKLWPDIIPGDASIYEVEARGATDNILMVAALIVIPVILAYITYQYYVFRGPVKKGGYAFKRTKQEEEYLQKARQSEARGDHSTLPAKHVPAIAKWGVGVGFLALFLMMNGPLGEIYVLISMPLVMGLLMVVLYKSEPG